MQKINAREIKINLLGGLTIALTMVSEAIAFALVAYVSPLTGLYAAFIVALITSVLGGRPSMVSGATGALAVVMVSLVVTHGVEYLFATVVLMGLLQILFAVAKLGKLIRMMPHLLFAVAKLGKLIRMMPHSVMLGFVNGLAIVIFLAQFEELLGHDLNKKIILSCGGLQCERSNTAALWTKELGYRHIYRVASGIKGWQDAGYPVKSIK